MSSNNRRFVLVSSREAKKIWAIRRKGLSEEEATGERDEVSWIGKWDFGQGGWVFF